MNENEKAKSALNEIKKMEFTSYNDFLKQAIENKQYTKFKNALGELLMYRFVCELCGEKADETYAETLSN